MELFAGCFNNRRRGLIIEDTKTNKFFADLNGMNLPRKCNVIYTI